MDSIETRLFAASLRNDLPTYDLHGLTISAALEKLDIFLYTIYEYHDQAGRVITGIGTGVLQEAVEQFLKKHPDVEVCKGESGSVLVLLK